MAERRCVVWSGELLWPQELPEGEVIDLGKVEAVGTWLYPWFRGRPHTAVVGAGRAIRRQMQRADLPILWYDSLDETRGSNGGVSPSERAMLWESETG